MSKPQLAVPRVAVRRASIAVRQGGASIAVCARDALAGEAAVTRLRRQVYALLGEPRPLAIAVGGLGTGQRARHLLSRLCIVLRWTLEQAHAQGRQIELVLPAAALAPGEALALRRQLLGPGSVHLIIDNSYFAPRLNPDNRARSETFWRQLWELRTAPDLHSAFAPMVSSPCPLLANETADAVQAPLALQAPAGSAWATAGVDLAGFADSAGRIDIAGLRNVLQQCVDSGETLHDQVRWPTPAMQADSWRNRRLAIAIAGIGDVVRRRGSNPCSLACLDAVCELLADIRSTLTLRSRELAESNAVLPALEAGDPTRRLQPGSSADWPERWQRALRSTALRHRNLLVMSPWSVLPAADTVDPRYFDLLPALGFADACSFAPRPSFRNCNVNQFIDLHNRARAVIEQKDARRLIAKQV